MSRPKPHVHVVDPSVPPDPLDRRDPPARACRDCGRMSRPGDAHHTMPDPVPDPRPGDG
ncbi:hypothetical protein FHR83_007038 [Actinoplanes campanulatus]|uniref:Uncharacterized protein n=1 Tax=Actinoplanes campanulatus TaxID=113559 RepID=A0A7W5AN42_9ACTN|nr:hypothetical protein [Actinoplanes campanulatus]MBB3099332.1 hypothetical protein [Actinoplanes campanulatus]